MHDNQSERATTMNNLVEALQEVFREVFEDDDLVLTRELTADEVEGWDSMAHLNLVIAVESTFGVRFATAEISKLKDAGENVGTFIDLLTEKVNSLG